MSSVPRGRRQAVRPSSPAHRATEAEKRQAAERGPPTQRPWAWTMAGGCWSSPLTSTLLACRVSLRRIGERSGTSTQNDLLGAASARVPWRSLQEKPVAGWPPILPQPCRPWVADVCPPTQRQHRSGACRLLGLAESARGSAALGSDEVHSSVS